MKNRKYMCNENIKEEIDFVHGNFNEKEKKEA